MKAFRHCSELHGKEKQAASSADMASASSKDNLLKQLTPFSIIPTQSLDALGETFDAHGKPICLLPKEELCKQHLFRRSVAILALSPDNSSLVACMPDFLFDVTCHDIISAGMATEEYASALIEKNLGMRAPMKFISTFTEKQMHISIFIARYSNSFLKARADANFMLSHLDEMRVLAEQNLLTPLLLSMLKVVNP